MRYLALMLAPILAFTLAIPLPIPWAGALWAGDLVLPRKPAKSEIPTRNHLGERVRGLSFRATSVSRRSDGQMLVMYGFIVGHPNGTANFFYWNDIHQVQCHGISRKARDGAGVGKNICTERGMPILRDAIRIPPSRYMRFSGTIRQRNHDLRGREIWTVLSWQLTGGFPDARPLIAAFRQ